MTLNLPAIGLVVWVLLNIALLVGLVFFLRAIYQYVKRTK